MPMFRRVLTGRVAPGKHGEFLRAVEEALDYQSAARNRGAILGLGCHHGAGLNR